MKSEGFHVILHIAHHSDVFVYYSGRDWVKSIEVLSYKINIVWQNRCQYLQAYKVMITEKLFLDELLNIDGNAVWLCHLVVFLLFYRHIHVFGVAMTRKKNEWRTFIP